jgi:hypothetical protein
MLRPVIFSMNHFSQWHVITFGQFGGTFYVMNATKLAILAGLRSNFYMLVSQKLPIVWSSTKHNNAKHTTTNMRSHHTLPPSSFAIFCHGNIHHGPKSWRRWSLWAQTRRAVLGALSLLFVPLFGAPKHNTSKIRERDVTLALGGHLLVGQHNNQPKVGIRGRRDIGEGARSGRNMWGWCHTIIMGGKVSNNKKKNVVALNGCRLIFQTQQPTKYTQA